MSKFHLRQFVDPDSLSLKDPWLWLGQISDGSIKRRAPKNVATERLMFDGPGGLIDRNATLESFLAHEVEGPAADAMREFCSRPSGSGGDFPPALMRYLAWAAARSLPMRQMFHDWMANLSASHVEELVEPPPDFLANATDFVRSMRMVHSEHGARDFGPGEDLLLAIREGWVPDYEVPANFLEAVHVQAKYFQDRFFPRLKWFTLHTPENESFIIGDRAVGWAADGFVNAPPSCLRHPSAYVLAPLSRQVVLVGRHQVGRWNVSPAQINTVVACWAHQWIAGPTEQVVRTALIAREQAMRAE